MYEMEDRTIAAVTRQVERAIERAKRMNQSLDEVLDRWRLLNAKLQARLEES